MPKPKSTTVKTYRVRVDCEGDEKVINFCKKYCETYIIVHHVTTTENPHYHFYAETTLSQGNFSNKIKTDMQVAGSDYSNKQCDLDRKSEFLSYLFNTKKGNVPRLVTYEGFSPIDIAIYRENADTIAREYEARVKSKKQTQYDVTEIVLERMQTADARNVETIYDIVQDVLKTCKMMARPNHVRDIIATVMARSGDPRLRTSIKENILKYFRYE